MPRLVIIMLSSALSLAACARTKAAGTNPSDMTAAEHREACLKHQREAAAYDQRAKDLKGGKGTYTAQYTRDEHKDIAKQHGDAAKVVDPNVDDCR